jgi:hypothetical protein
VRTRPSTGSPPSTWPAASVGVRRGLTDPVHLLEL